MKDLQSDLEIQLQGFRLTTAQIYYHLPDHPALLQEFIWQHYDLAPKFPHLYKFLNFWHKEIDAPVHSVYVAKKELIRPGEAKFYAFEMTLQ